MTTLIEKARKFASDAHAETNHTYDGHPYSFHLAMAAKFAEEFAYLLPEEMREEATATAWTHDTIEDARLTYNDVKKELGENIAEYTYLVTNLRGRNRKERAGSEYYKGVVSRMVSAYVKLCDRLANVSHSVANGSRMAAVYKKELPGFKHYFNCGWAPSDAPSLDAYKTMVDTMFERLEGILA